jgi:hypothetical protein
VHIGWRGVLVTSRQQRRVLLSDFLGQFVDQLLVILEGLQSIV